MRSEPVYQIIYYLIITAAGFMMTTSNTDPVELTEIHWIRYSSHGKMADIRITRAEGNIWNIQDAITKSNWKKELPPDWFTSDELERLSKTFGSIHTGQEDYVLEMTRHNCINTITFSREKKFSWIIEKMARVEDTLFEQ